MPTALSTRIKDICLVRSGTCALAASWLIIASAISPLSAQTVNPEDSPRRVDRVKSSGSGKTGLYCGTPGDSHQQRKK